MNLMLVPRLAAFLACAGIVSAAHAEAETATRPIDVALVLAIDVSRSISFDEQRLQLAGYAAAFRDRAETGQRDRIDAVQTERHAV